ncbi:MAG: PorP/SprF family type IX secretion system membrane protein, partial [Bacteroidia bacterium]|nr:PorP/SprF family type IX secretion system membrane protein [Bacteroidia bacterium]
MNIAAGSYGQDIHFSQFNASLLNLSPGYTGFFNGDYRVSAAYRSQWNAVPVSYNTFSMSGERRFRPLRLKKDMVGVGLLFNNDRAGDAHYGTTQFYLQGSYIFLAKPDSSLLISLGANVGWCRVGFDYSKMTFENQYDGYAYNQTLQTGEQFNWTVRNFADISLGSAIQYIHNGKHRFTYAIGVHHLSSPTISYQGNDASKLDYKFTNILSYSTPIKENTDIIAEALVSNQGKYYELIPHVSLKYYMKREENKAILGGLCYRSRDAVVFRMGYTQGTLQSGISYDINISRFNAASNFRGGFELFIN